MGFASIQDDMLDSWNERDHLITGEMPCSPMDNLTDNQPREEIGKRANQDDQSKRPPLR